MKKSALFLSIIGCSVFAMFSFAGNLDPPSLPDDSSSAMYTLDDIYNRADTGAAGTKRTGIFAEPTAPPSGTGHTTDDIMSKMPSADNLNGAEPGDVTSGKTYWGLRTDGTWGLQAGSKTCFISNGNGTVSDQQTGLMWIQIPDAVPRDWAAANSYCSSLDYAGYNDWRLPELYELYALVDKQNSNPSLPSNHPFSNIQGSFWTNSENNAVPSQAWAVNMDDGIVFSHDKNGGICVWAVRANHGTGQSEGYEMEVWGIATFK